MNRKYLIAGNWKMNKTSDEAVELVREIVQTVGQQMDVEVVVCPPFTALSSVAPLLEGATVKLGAQNMHPAASGAFTGEISAEMIRSHFASYVILGHSERRSLFGETDAFINEKVQAAIKNQLKPILCVGESLGERQSGADPRGDQDPARRWSGVGGHRSHCEAWSLPMSRSGRSAPVRWPRRIRPRRFTLLSARGWKPASTLRWPRRPASFTVGR